MEKTFLQYLYMYREYIHTPINNNYYNDKFLEFLNKEVKNIKNSYLNESKKYSIDYRKMNKDILNIKNNYIVSVEKLIIYVKLIFEFINSPKDYVKKYSQHNQDYKYIYNFLCYDIVIKIDNVIKYQYNI